MRISKSRAASRKNACADDAHNNVTRTAAPRLDPVPCHPMRSIPPPRRELASLMEKSPTEVNENLARRMASAARPARGRHGLRPAIVGLPRRRPLDPIHEHERLRQLVA